MASRASVLLASIVALILAAPAVAQRGGGGSHGGGGGHGGSGGGMRGGSGGSHGGARGSGGGYRGSVGSYHGSGSGYRSSPGTRSGFRPAWGSSSGRYSGYHGGTRPSGGGYHPGYGGRHGYPGYGYNHGYPHNYYHGAYWGGYGFYPWYVSTWWWWGTPYWGWGWNWWPPYGYAGYPGYAVAEDAYYGRVRFAAVKTDITPEESEVWLDGQYIGTADDFDGYPDYLYLKPGKYHFEFKVVGYEPLATDLEVTRGELTKIDQKLKRLPGTSKFQEFPKSRGMPYGRFLGPGGKPAGDERAPRVGERYDVAPYGAAPAGDDFDLPPPKTDRMPPSAVPSTKPGRARLRFSVLPEDAAIYVDDKYVGAGEDLNNSPRGMITDPGAHTVVVTRPGFKTKSVQIEAKAGQPIDVVVDLEKQ